MKLLLVGMPLSTHRRLKTEAEQWSQSVLPDVVYRAVPSQNDHLPEITQRELNDIKASVQAGFVHIVVVPSRKTNWNAVLEAFRYDCRVVLLRFGQEFRDWTWNTVQGLLESVITFEQRWLQIICPTNLRHALLLPPPSFEPMRDVGDFWQSCDVYGKTELLARAHDLLQRATARHRRKREGSGHVWVDYRGRQFAFDPTLHGRAPEERAGLRRFRFCFSVPPGFHFDVQHESGQHFVIIDKNGATRRALHANVDPWGNVRC